MLQHTDLASSIEDVHTHLGKYVQKKTIIHALASTSVDHTCPHARIFGFMTMQSLDRA